MLNYQALRDKTTTIQQATAGWGKAELRREFNEMYDRVETLIADATDADVVFLPIDPLAHDSYAANPEDSNLAWTLGHVIVHLTASAEESAALSAELARGVEFHGRSRAEVPWQQATTIDFCRARMAESRRMCLAALEMWPDFPHLENTYTPREGVPPINAVTRFMSGLRHAFDHLGQIEDILRQSQQSKTVLSP